MLMLAVGLHELCHWTYRQTDRRAVLDLLLFSLWDSLEHRLDARHSPNKHTHHSV